MISLKLAESNKRDLDLTASSLSLEPRSTHGIWGLIPLKMPSKDGLLSLKSMSRVSTWPAQLLCSTNTTDLRWTDTSTLKRSKCMERQSTLRDKLISSEWFWNTSIIHIWTYPTSNIPVTTITSWVNLITGASQDQELHMLSLPVQFTWFITIITIPVWHGSTKTQPSETSLIHFGWAMIRTMTTTSIDMRLLNSWRVLSNLLLAWDTLSATLVTRHCSELLMLMAAERSTNLRCKCISTSFLITVKSSEDEIHLHILNEYFYITRYYKAMIKFIIYFTLLDQIIIKTASFKLFN